MVNTFMPYSNYKKCAKVLDNKRLLKQRVEAYQIINVLEGKTSGWKNHPIVKMWVGYTESLKLYCNIMIQETIDRGFKNNMKMYEIADEKIEHPWWVDYEVVNYSHRASLIRKDTKFYLHIFFPKDSNGNTTNVKVIEEYLLYGYLWTSDLSEKKKNKIIKYLKSLDAPTLPVRASPDPARAGAERVLSDSEEENPYKPSDICREIMKDKKDVKYIKLVKKNKKIYIPTKPAKLIFV